jgi:hypothetical protein
MIQWTAYPHRSRVGHGQIVWAIRGVAAVTAKMSMKDYQIQIQSRSGRGQKRLGYDVDFYNTFSARDFTDFAFCKLRHF